MKPSIEVWLSFLGPELVSGRCRRVGGEHQARQEQEVPHLQVEPRQAGRQAQDAGVSL